MAKRITHEIASARFVMFAEAAEHLSMSLGYSTDDPTEGHEGANFCARQVNALADHWFKRAKELSDSGLDTKGEKS